MRDRHANRDRWRSLSHQEGKRPTGSRKVLTLVVMLVLILMCIYQLNDPNTFGPAFRAIGLTPSLQPPNSEPERTSQAVNERVVAQPSRELEELAEVWQAVLKGATEDQLARLLIYYGPTANTSTDGATLPADPSISQLWASIDSQLSQETQRPNAMADDFKFHNFAAKWQGYRGNQSLDLPDDLLNSLRLALDHVSKH